MKKTSRFIGFIILVLGLVGLAGCCRQAHPASFEGKDSVRIERQYVETVRYDTVRIEAPVEQSTYMGAADSSVLETSLAVSTAKITADGELYHDLRNKPVERAVVVPVKDTRSVERMDSVRVERQTLTIEVPARLTWWQRTWIIAGYSLSGVTVIYLIIKLLKLWLLKRK